MNSKQELEREMESDLAEKSTISTIELLLSSKSRISAVDLKLSLAITESVYT